MAVHGGGVDRLAIYSTFPGAGQLYVVSDLHTGRPVVDCIRLERPTRGLSVDADGRLYCLFDDLTVMAWSIEELLDCETIGPIHFSPLAPEFRPPRETLAQDHLIVGMRAAILSVDLSSSCHRARCLRGPRAFRGGSLAVTGASTEIVGPEQRRSLSHQVLASPGPRRVSLRPVASIVERPSVELYRARFLVLFLLNNNNCYVVGWCDVTWCDVMWWDVVGWGGMCGAMTIIHLLAPMIV